MIGNIVRVKSIGVSIVAGMLFCSMTVHAGVSVAACCNSRGACPYSIGDTWNDTYNGTSYYCQCTSGGGSCAPAGGSGGTGGSGGGHGGKDAWKYQMIQDIFNGAMKQNAAKAVYSPDIGISKADADKLKQQQLRSKQEAEMKFKIESGELNTQLKGGIAPPMKGASDLSSFARTEAVKKTEKVLKELSCSAYWGLNAVHEAGTVGVTKELNDSFSVSSRYAHNSAMAKGAESGGECPEIVMNIPEAPLPIESDPQVQVYAYIVKKTEALLPQMVQTRQKIAETDRRIETLKKEKKPKNDVQSDEVKKRADEALKREALELEKKAEEEKKEISNLQVMYNDVSSNPEHAEEWMRKVK
jgi:hypothetical protein